MVTGVLNNSLENNSTSDVSYQLIYEDYLFSAPDLEFGSSTDLPTTDSESESNKFCQALRKKFSSGSMNSASTMTTQLIDSATKASVESIEIPTRSPARLMKKSNDTPSSPSSILDSSSVEYTSYGSDRSSQVSIFSDISDKDQFEEPEFPTPDSPNYMKHARTTGQKFQDMDPINLEDEDYEQVLELLGYNDKCVVQTVERVSIIHDSMKQSVKEIHP